MRMLVGMEFDFSLSNPHIASGDLGSPVPMSSLPGSRNIKRLPAARPMLLGQIVLGGKFCPLVTYLLPSLMKVAGRRGRDACGLCLLVAASAQDC